MFKMRVLLVLFGFALLGLQAKSLKGSNSGEELVEAASDPENYEHHWDDGKKGDTGYIKNSEDKAKKGYKHFDSYHKKDKDNYDFEHHTEFGHGEKDAKDGYQHHSKYQKAQKGGKHSEDDNGGEGKATHHSYQVTEDSGEAPGNSYHESDFIGGLAPLLDAADYQKESSESSAEHIEDEESQPLENSDDYDYE